MPFLKKKERFSTSPIRKTVENSSPDMNKVEKWLDEVDEKPEFEAVESEPSPIEDESKWNRVADNSNTEIPKVRIIKKKTKVGFRRKEKKTKRENNSRRNNII